MDKIIEKYKSNPDAMYEISKEPDSYDQKKFKNSLQKIFGKTTGKNIKEILAEYLELRDEGFITDEDYEYKKKKLLKKF